MQHLHRRAAATLAQHWFTEGIPRPNVLDFPQIGLAAAGFFKSKIPAEGAIAEAWGSCRWEQPKTRRLGRNFGGEMID